MKWTVPIFGLLLGHCVGPLAGASDRGSVIADLISSHDLSRSGTSGAVSLKIPRHSVSGFSAGASAAVIHLVAFSSLVDGMGIIGGSPYGCNSLPDAGDTCSGFVSTGHWENTSIPWGPFVSQCQRYLAGRAASGLIDNPRNLSGKPVYLFSGTDDVWVYQSVMRAAADQFHRLNASVATQFDLPAAHSWVVDSETCSHPGRVFGASQCCGHKDGSTVCPLPPHAANPINTGCCGICKQGDGDDKHPGAAPIGWRPPINNCNFDLAGEVLRWIYGADRIRARVPQNAVTPANLIQFDQTPFLPKGWNSTAAQLDEFGFVYAPTQCRVSIAECRVHVHYHPCGGSFRDVSTSYMLENGLAAYAEANRMVVLFPQSAKDGNPAGDGCFDWYGCTDVSFDTHDGPQLQTVIAMLRNLAAIVRNRTRV